MAGVTISKAQMVEHLADRMSFEEIGELYEIHKDSARRLARQYGLLRPPPKKLTADQRALGARLLEDGAPMTWVAETLGTGSAVIHRSAWGRAAMKRRPVDAVSTWLSTWPYIRRNPTLVALHRQFAPSSTA